MTGIVGPRDASAEARSESADPVESKMTEDPGVKKQSMGKPVQAPAPASESKESGKEASQEAPGAEAKSEADSRVPNRRPRVVHRRTPNIGGIVYRHVNHLRIGRLNLDVGLAVVSNHLLRRVLKPSVALCPPTHSLHGVHHISLLSEKGVAQIRSPSNIAIQQSQRVRKCHHCLDACIPRLLLGGVNQLGSPQVGVLLEPPVGLHHF